MKHFAIPLCALVVAACAPPAPEVPYERVTEEIFLTQIVGKKLVYKGNYAISNADGTVEGTFAGGFKGTWEWVDGYWCRVIKGKEGVPENDCQLFEIAGDKVRNTRDKGKGRTVIYTIEG